MAHLGLTRLTPLQPQLLLGLGLLLQAQAVPAGNRFPVLLPAVGSVAAEPVAASSAASRFAPGILGSLGPTGSQSSFGSQAWPLLVAPSQQPGASGMQRDESGLQLPGESYLERRNSIGSAGGVGSGERWEGGRDPTALCETWLVTELCDRWGAATAVIGLLNEGSFSVCLLQPHTLGQLFCTIARQCWMCEVWLA